MTSSKSASSRKPVASAILAVYNAESTIEACLASLITQSVPLEIIVIDDGSTDNTYSSIVRTIELYPQSKVKMFKQDHGGPALARNLGANHATTDIMLFVDADMTFDPEYVTDLIKPIQHGQVIGTYTVEERVANWDNRWARCWNIQEGWDEGKRFPHNPPKYGTDFRAILKSEFDKVGGFDNIGYTDTWSLFNKLGVRPLSTKAVCYHKNPDTLRSVFRQARWAAKRPYKYGFIGTLYALLRTSLPVSIVAGISKSYRDRNFVIFKLVYDLGRFVGILEMIMTGKLAK
jgi:glycosyltransferase involved in cell wall biosynthesis